MLSNNTLATPRPRPPAKARRSPSLNFPPPPPYAPRLEMLLGSPIGVTTQLLGSTAEEPNPTTQAMGDWMNERSKEELSELLVKAGGLIKSRETELGLTSALCKNLYHDNIALKTKHEALLSHFPSGSGNTPSPPLSSAQGSSPSLAQSPHYYSASLPRTPNDSPVFHSPALSRPRHGHGRKPSVTPADLAILADQNAELLDKLEKLEEESERNEKVSRRKLGKLEKEIQGLKEELERTQEKELELEEKAKVLGEAELQRRKEEREDRIWGMKEQDDLELSSEDPTQAFVPTLELSHPERFNPLAEARASSEPCLPPALNLATKPTFVGDVPSNQHPMRALSPRPEYALISQLLRKIQELEETNAQIYSEQRTTEERFRTAQKEAETIRKAYDSLEEDLSEAHIIDVVSPYVPAEETIKYDSLRRTADGDLQLYMEEDEEHFASGISDEMRSTTRNTPPGVKAAAVHRPRKSVVGLFDTPTTVPRSHAQASSMSLPLPRSELADMSTWSIAAVDSFDDHSPVMSTLGLNMYPHHAGPSLETNPQCKHTLGSELGSEFGDDWGENAGNYHLRASSLCDLTHLTTISRGNSASPPADKPMLFHTPMGSPRSESGWEDIDGPVVVPPTSGGVTPSGARPLSLVIDPPTPSRPGRYHTGSLVLRESRSNRNLRLSETVRARTNRWVEGRYGEPGLVGPVRRRRPTRGHSSRGSDASMIFSETFDVVVRQLSFNGVPGDDGALAEEDEDTVTAVSQEKALELRGDGGSALAHPPRRREGFVGFILEVWLWLQFAIVVMVFLWAMAKRGPKNVLQEAERRKTNGGLRR